jgi:hypothetical protein
MRRDAWTVVLAYALAVVTCTGIWAAIAAAAFGGCP